METVSILFGNIYRLLDMVKQEVGGIYQMQVEKRGTLPNMNSSLKQLVEAGLQRLDVARSASPNKSTRLENTRGCRHSCWSR